MEDPGVRNSAGDARDHAVVTQSGQIHHLTQNFYGPRAPGERASDTGEGRGREIRQRSRARQGEWIGVPHQGEFFVGRERFLADLEKSLNTGREPALAALVGMAGAGKTALAKEYLYRHADDYDLVCWIPSGHVNLVRRSFLELASGMGFGDQWADTEQPVTQVLEALRRGNPFPRWLLVYDNAQSRAELQRFLPVGGQGHVIVTSRDGSWDPPGGRGSLAVPDLERAESVQLLRLRSQGSLTDTEADRLAEEFGDLPSALNQAVVWLHESGMSAAEYLEQFAHKNEEMIRLLEPEDPDYQIPVAAAWNVSLDRLAVTNPGALQLLQLCSLLPSRPVPVSAFGVAPGKPCPPELGKLLEDRVKLNQAVRSLVRASLARFDRGAETVSVHPLVAAAVRSPMRPTELDELDRHAVWIAARFEGVRDGGRERPR